MSVSAQCRECGSTTIPRWDKVLQLLLDVAQGAMYLHDKQIIHGDLKVR